jgi:sugar phosphate isomerase/epimerase
MLRLGGPVFADPQADPEQLARAHQEKGYTAAFAPPIPPNDHAAASRVRRAFEQAGVMIAEVGFWENLVDTDPHERAANRRIMTETLALADELGARCAVNIFGSYSHGNGNACHAAANYSEDAFAEAVTMARAFIDAVKPKTAFFAYEAFAFNLVDSPEMIARLVRAVDRKQFGVHLDLANLINSPRAYWNSKAIIQECIRRFGDRIVSAHVKDLHLREPALSVMLEETVPGRGRLDLAALLRGLHALPQTVPLMMEHLHSEAEYDEAAAHIRKLARAEGLSL